MSILLKNARLIETRVPFSVKENVDVLIVKDRIAKVGKNLSDKADKVIDCTNKTVAPGMVCSHHHYYSGLSRGILANMGTQTDFIQVLKELWWRLDRALDKESCYYSSLICSIDAIKCGTTSCIDHHASPSYIEGSLSTMAKGMEEVGVRGIECYEITNRNGGFDEETRGLDENVRFAKEVDAKRKKGEDVLVEAAIGGHAPFTMSNEIMEKMGDACKDTNRGIHLHVGEDKYDQVHSHHMFHDDILVRLDKNNLLNEKAILVHGIYLRPENIEMFNSYDGFMINNARSNMNNNVGYNSNLPLYKNPVLGTDGCGSNMFEEIKLSYFKHKDASGKWWPNDYLDNLTRGNLILERYFNDKFGRLQEGYKADIIILDYNSPTPLVKENLGGHFVFGMGSDVVETTIVNGKIIMENRVIKHLDLDSIYKKASEEADKMWKRMNAISAH